MLTTIFNQNLLLAQKLLRKSFNYISTSSGIHTSSGIQNSSRNKKQVETLMIKGEVLYGIAPVAMALESNNRHFHQVFYNPDSKRSDAVVNLAKMKGIPCRKMERSALNQLARHSTKEVGVHQGVCADVDPISQKLFKYSDLEQKMDDAPKLYLLLCGLSDPHNLGAILRTSYFLGVDRVLTCSYLSGSTPLSPVVSKASSGVLEVFTPEVVRDPETYLDHLSKNEHWEVMATGVPDSSNGMSNPIEGVPGPSNCVPGPNHLKLHRKNIFISETKANESNSGNPKNLLLLIGNEGSGIHKELLKFCDLTITLAAMRTLHPMVDSLNVSVATALIIQYLKSEYLTSYS